MIPELNLWSSKILFNNNLTINYIDNPVKVSEKWRCRDSVIELLFNECYDPTGKLHDDHYYIYKYKTVNLDRLIEFDPALNRRIQIYKNRMYVYVADDPDNEDFKEISNLVTPSYIIDDGFTTNTDTIASSAGVTPTKFVNKYQSEIITTGTDELYQQLADREDPDDPSGPGVYTPGENIFNFTQEELEMLEYLYYYRTGQFELICCFPHDFYYSLKSPLSKWIYLYLQCYLFNVVNYEFLNTITTENDDILRRMFEKHAQDRIYQYIQKQHSTIWNKIEDIGGTELRRVFENYTMPCQTFVWRKRIFESDIDNYEIPIKLDEQDQPVENYNFEFIYDGILLKQGIDYDVINKGTLKDTKTYIILKDISKFKINTKYQLMWSSLILTTPMTRDFYFANSCGSKGNRNVINMYCNDFTNGNRHMKI